MPIRIRSLMVAILLLAGSLFPPQPVCALSKIIYADTLAPGWADWSWAQVNLAATTPVHGGANSIAVIFGAWEGLYLHNPAVDTLGTPLLRFYLHGGSTGGQKMNVFFNLEVNGSPQNGPAVSVPSPAANTWNEVRIPVSSLNPTGAPITGITWQGSVNSTQPVIYFDDIAFISDEDPNAPQIAGLYLSPRSIVANGFTRLVVRAAVTDPQGASDITSITLDTTSLGRGLTQLHDDGRSSDGAAGDGIFGATFSAAPGTAIGEKPLLLSATDSAGHSASASLGWVSVLGSAGGSIPPSLPQRIGWGSNAWSETPGEDWQVNSGVPWNYIYQYITYGWETWGANFTYRFVHQAWEKNFIPMVTVYLMLGTPPTCGEGGTCYAQKLQNTSAVSAYLASLQRAAQQASGTKPVIFNIEPDFYGYMQQLSNSPSRPAGVNPNDPASYPVALNKTGYPNNLAGFGRYLVDLIHTTAPNALVAPMASMWAMNNDPQNLTDMQAIQMAQTTAAFIDAMGGAQSDALVVEWSDRDSGWNPVTHPFWDDTDAVLPRPTRATLWENALSRAANKRLFLWQMPVGNMSLDNTPYHYQDNRAAYAFSHPGDLFEAGVIGVLFGGGMDTMTQVDTDGGFVAAQGAIAYANPPTPTGFSAGTPAGATVPLWWNDVTIPDLAGYRIYYRQSGSVLITPLDISRRNSFTLLLPYAATWELHLAALDAMGNESAHTSIIYAVIGESPATVYLPIIRR